MFVEKSGNKFLVGKFFKAKLKGSSSVEYWKLNPYELRSFLSDFWGHIRAISFARLSIALTSILRLFSSIILDFAKISAHSSPRSCNAL